MVEANSMTTKERLMVCVGNSPSSADVIWATKKMANSLNAEWFAVHVKTPATVHLSEAEQNQAIQNLQLAEHLGAQTFTLFSNRMGEKIGDFARRHNITRIIAGKSDRHRWHDLIFGSIVDELVRASNEIDIYFITGKPEKTRETPLLIKPRRIPFFEYGMGFLYSIVVTALNFLIYPYFELSNLIMVYLVGVMVTAIHWGRGPAIFNAIINILTFYYFFVPIRYSFTLVETHFIFTFAVMLLVALVISHLTILIRGQADAARLQERQIAAMHGLSRQLATSRGVENILQVALKQLGETFECQVVALLPVENDNLQPVAGDFSWPSEKDKIKELSVAKWSFRTGQIAGWGTQTSSDSPFLYVPLQATKAVIGVLALRLKDPKSELWLLPEQLHVGLLKSLAKQLALALEVDRLEQAVFSTQMGSIT